MDDRARELVAQHVGWIDQSGNGHHAIRNDINCGELAAAISAYGDEREREALEQAARTAESFFGAHDKRLITGVHIADAIRRSLIKESK